MVLTNPDSFCSEPSPAITPKIACLPTELMQMIFRRAAGLLAHESGRSPARSWNKCAILVSHVCVLWRNLAIGDTFLWSSIPVTTANSSSVQYFQAFINRSKSHRLVIEINHSEGDASRLRLTAIFNLLNPHGVRIGSLSMKGCNLVGGDLQEKFAFAAPILQTLRLSTSEPLPWAYGNIFGCHFPLLRRVELYGWNDWSPPYIILRDITHLTLSFDTVLYVPWKNLMATLAQCLRLKHMVFRYISVVLEPPDKHTSLTHLRTLLFDRSDSASILSYLALPSTVNVTVWEEPESSNVMVMPSDCSRLHSLDDITKACMIINLEDVALVAHNRNEAKFEWSQVAYLDSVDGEYDDLVTDSVRYMLRVSIPQFRPFDGIQDFSIYCEKFEPELFARCAWDDILRHWPALNMLTLYNFPIEEVMLALTPSTHAITCPQLDVIQLQILEANVEMFNVLINLFRTRESLGSRIGTLRIRIPREEYRTYRDEVRLLKGCVHRMEVQRL
jgi:hypothetical protein